MSESLTPIRTVEATYLEKALSYDAFKAMTDALLAEGKTTGPIQSEAFIHYTQLNHQRVHRLEKTTVILPGVREKMLSITRAQIWLVLTEAWCGDAAQSIPVMQLLAQLNPLVTLRLLLRDENLELMDRYLTRGVSRSIPKLIAIDPLTREELFTWGPRPTVLQETFYRMRSEGILYDDIKEELQRWYNKDKTSSIQRELMELATSVSGKPVP